MYVLSEELLQVWMKGDMWNGWLVVEHSHECLTGQSSGSVYLFIALLHKTTHSSRHSAVT